MASTSTSKSLLVAATTALLCGYGCSSSELPVGPFPPQAAGADQGTAGSGASTSASGGSSTGISGGSSMGTAGVGTTPGGAGAGAGMTPGGAGAGTTTGGSNAGGMSGAGGTDITKVWKSNGCGKAYGGPTGGAAITLPTMGVKDANCNDKLLDGTPRCGAWGQPSSAWLTTPLTREYYVYLPAGYDDTKPYPVVFQGSGCGGNGTQTYPLSDGAGANAGNSVIRIGLTPASTDIIGHGCCPFGCFDDKEGDDSVDWMFYENLYDKLTEELCIDRNRVFASGNSSGAWFANELGCKYAGDTARPVRAVLSNAGTLPVSPAEVPTCTQARMAGMWLFETNDPAFTGMKVAINRAIARNGCTAANYDSAAKENFPIGGGLASDVCKRVSGCDPLFPLVVCELPGNAQGSHDNIANPGFSTLLKLFSTGELISY